VQRRGVHATMVSTTSSQPPMIADELRRQADVFTDLTELRSIIERELPNRSADIARATLAVHRGAEPKVISSS
jgi:uncharacterized LabA/DUF88 family protein